MRANNLTSSTMLVITLSSLLALSACSKEPADGTATSPGSEAKSADISDPANPAGPGINPAVAPGVAFTFSYAFTLPGKAISGVQQRHALACERLGPKSCRVVGMSYEQPHEDSVEASLDFRLAPDLAQHFASEGIAAVEAAQGRMDHATVNGRDAGDAIRLSQGNSAIVTAEIARIHGRLNARGLSATERADLQRRLSDLEDQLGSNETERRGHEQALASTPVRFSYASEGLLGGRNSFGKAAAASWGSAEAALSFLLLVLGLALPWIGLSALVVLALRWIRRRQTIAPTAPSAP